MDANAAPDFAPARRGEAEARFLPNSVHRFTSWTVWAAMTAATVFLVVCHGVHMPMMDDYHYIVPVLIGEQPLTLNWLGAYYADNLIPFAKLVNVSLLHATGYNFLAAPFFSTLWMAALSAGLIRTAERLRGGPSFSDGIFPVLLLGWQHWENLAWGMTLTYVVSQMAIGIVLLILLRYRRVPFGMTILAGELVMLFPWSGPAALAHVPVLVVWLCVQAYLTLKDGGRGAVLHAGLFLVQAFAATLNTALYFRFHQADETLPPTHDLVEICKGVYQVLGAALASDHVSMMRPLGEEGGLEFWMLTSAFVLGLCLSSLPLLFFAWQQQATERLRLLALALFCGGAFALFFSLSRARIAQGPLYGQSRYAVLSMPLVCCLYCAWVRYGPGRTRIVAPALLFAAVCACAPLNFRYGWNYLADIRAGLNNFLADLEDGKPTDIAIDRSYEAVAGAPGDRAVDELVVDMIAGRIRRMNELEMPPFDTIPPDPETKRIEEHSPKAASTRNVRRKGTHWVGQDRQSFLEFRFPRPCFALAVLLKYRLQNDTETPASGVVYWKESGVNEYTDEERTATLRLVPQPADKKEPDIYRVWIWVNGRLDRIRLHPDEAPFAIRVEEITLLVPR